MQWKNMYANSSKQQWAINDSSLGKQLILLRDRPLGNVLAGEGGGGFTKKLFMQGKVKWKKYYVCQVNLKNIQTKA